MLLSLLAQESNRRRVAAALCLPLIAVLLIFGWWPFTSPPNEVSWLPGENAVRFGKRATIFSNGALPPATHDGACTMEVWLTPALNHGNGTVLGFYGPEGARGLSLQQSHTDLRLDSPEGGGRPSRRYVQGLLRAGRPVFITVVAGSGGIAVYRDGWPVTQFDDLRIPRDVCSGAFVLGDSPEEDLTLEGTFRGLAIYARELTPEQARTSYWSWHKYGTPAHSGNAPPAALYLFNEGHGRQIIDHGTTRVNLTIPERYTIARKVFLKSPWRAFQWTSGYLGDLLLNVVGFVPLGFLAAAAMPSRWRRVWLIGALAGLTVSLAIEVGQMRLPTRNSDLTDIFTNTLGAAVGALLWLQVLRRSTRHPL